MRVLFAETRVCMFMGVCALVCVCLSVCLCVGVSMSVYACVSISVYACVSMSVYACVYMSLSSYTMSFAKGRGILTAACKAACLETSERQSCRRAVVGGRRVRSPLVSVVLHPLT